MSINPVGIVGDGERLAIIAICNLDVVQNKPYATHLQFAFRLARDNPEFQFILYTPYRMTIANFRNMAAISALESGAEYLMFIDDDAVLINNSGIFKYLKDKIDNDDNKHIIMPVVYVRGYPFNPMFFKFVTDEEAKTDGKLVDFYTDFKDVKADEKGLLEVAAIGCHTCLIKTEIFKALEKPYFLTGMNHTEDVYFCLKCRDYIENIGIYVDTTSCIGHLLDPIWVDDLNVKLLREFYEKMGLSDQFNLKEHFSQPDTLERQLNSAGEEFQK